MIIKDYNIGQLEWCIFYCRPICFISLFTIVHILLILISTLYIHTQEDWVLCRVFYKSREVGARTGLESCFGDTNGSKSLPPLMDSNYISFDYQAAQDHVCDQYHEQVPCFSNIIFPQNQSSTNISPILKHHLPDPMENSSSNLPTKVGSTFSSSGTIMPNNDPYSCDNEVLKAVLSHFAKMESNNQSLKGSPSLGEGSSESYLSDVGIPNIWSHYWYL